MLLSGLAYLSYLFAGRRRLELVVSAVAAALTVLTKTPGIFIVPLAGLFTLIETVKYVAEMPGRPWRALFHPKTLARAAAPLLAWAAIMLVVYVALWPALWVAPRDTLAEVMDISGDYAEQGHSSPVFYAGRIFNGDPGTWFYPVNYLWRTTPIVLVGLLLVVPALFRRNAATRPRRVLYGVLSLALWAFFFIVAMNLGAKKFDRYILPIFMPLDLVAGIGWAAAVYWLARSARPWATRYAAPGLAALALAGQAFSALPTYPYYITYYNPLMGGAARAPDTMMIGWGEGADEAARYLNTLPDADRLTVASGYTNGPFSYFFRGKTLPITFWHEADYAIVYAQDWQRQLPSRRAVAHFSRYEPVHVVQIDGLDYAHIYDLHQMPLPDYVTDWGAAIRLVSYQLPAASISPGESFRAIFYFVNLAPIDSNLNVLVRIVGPDGQELSRSEGWPWGAATSSWQHGVVWPDGHDLAIPPGAAPGYYRVEAGFYDPAGGELLGATNARTGEPAGDLVTLDYIRVGDPPTRPAHPLTPAADLGGLVRLTGADWRAESGAGLRPDRLALQAGSADRHALLASRAAHRRRLYGLRPCSRPGWRSSRPGRRPTVERLHACRQLPGCPKQGRGGQAKLAPSVGAAEGDYTICTGLYDLATMQRLPVTRQRAVRRRAILATVTVRPAP